MAGITNRSDAVYDTWAEVVALLSEAADRGYRDSATDPATHSIAVTIHGLAASAIALLPPEIDDVVDEIVLAPAYASMSVVELIRAAEASTRRPIYELPVGASEVIVAICDLFEELAA
jgi:hypothetical protein